MIKFRFWHRRERIEVPGDPIRFCVGNYLENVRRLISQIYAGRNYKGHFIMEITAVENVGDCTIAMDSASYIDVDFEARVLAESEGGIVMARAVKTESQVMLLRKNPDQSAPGAVRALPQPTSVVVLVNPPEGVILGQMVPVLVSRAHHAAFKCEIVTAGNLYEPRLRDMTTYRVVEARRPPASARLASLVEEVGALIAKRGELFSVRHPQSSHVWFFEALLAGREVLALGDAAAPKSPTVVTDPAGAAWVGPEPFGESGVRPVSIFEMIKMESLVGTWRRSAISTYPGAGLVEAGGAVDGAVEVSALEMLEMLAVSVCNSMAAVTDLASMSAAEIASHKNIWRLMAGAS